MFRQETSSFCLTRNITSFKPVKIFTLFHYLQTIHKAKTIYYFKLSFC